MDYVMLCQPKEAVQSFDQSFEVEYTHNSTAIEGNTLTLIQTKAVLEDGISVGGKTLREIYEVVNHSKAFQFVKQCVAEGKPLNENIVKDIHALLMENILPGGIYRNVEVRISGAQHKPPVPSEMYRQVKEFYATLPYRDGMNAIELAAWLMAAGFLPVSIAKENRLSYFEALEAYAVGGDLKPFAEMIASLEEQRLEEYLGIMQEPAQENNDPELTM